MTKQTQAERLDELTAKASLTVDECTEIARMSVARVLTFRRGVMLPDSAFAIPGKSRFLTLEGTTVRAGHLRDLANWPSLTRISLERCRIDESGLGELRSAAKLVDLWLEDTNLTDAGLNGVGRLTQLEWLTIGGTAVTDAGLASLRDLDLLKTLWVDRTSITDAGLLQLAGLPRLSTLNSQRSRVSNGGEDAFFRAQQEILKTRRGAQRAGSAKPPVADPADLDAAKAVFLEFSRAMAAWEAAWVTKGGTVGDVDDACRATQETACRAIFARFCSDRPRVYGRPNAMHFSTPSDYHGIKVDSVELDGPRRIHVHVSGRHGWKYRYAIVKRGDRWLVDNAQWWDGGWKSHDL